MRRLFIPLALVTLLAPAAAFAGSGQPNPGDLAAQACKTQRTQMGSATFNATYGTNKSKSNAFGKCVAKMSQSASNDVSNAAKACKAEKADPNFAASHGGKTFDAFYGSNTQAHGKGAGANAFGKCVSQKAKAAVSAQTHASVSAAKACRAALAASKTAFATAYGSGRNAFGKCVSQKAHGK
jgi:hypothetical protein